MFNDYDIFYGMPFFVPKIPVMNEKPPTLYAIMNSIVNYGKEEKTKIKDLASIARTTIFDFDYPLNENIEREDFECLILNKFLMRRIGFETLTAFKIQLNVKLNEIMPVYNQLFELIYEDKAFGEITKRSGFDNRIINGTSHNSSTINNTASNETENTTENSLSDTPQNELDNIRNNRYITEFNRNVGNTTSTDSSEQTGTSNTTENQTNNNTYEETTSRINLLEVYSKLNSEIKNVYSLIFNELECLFYQII